MQEKLPKISIREATPNDAMEATDVFEAAFAPLRSIYQPIGNVAAHEARRANEGTRLVAEIETRIVATVQYAVHESHVHIIGLAVHPNFQQMGIARQLIEHIVNLSPSLDRRIVRLDTIKETGNDPLFKRSGFHIVSEQTTSEFTSKRYSQLHEVIMERSIK